MKKTKNKNEMPPGLQESLQSMYNGLAEQYESIDSAIESHEHSIKQLNKQKKDIEKELAYLETLNIGVMEADGEEVNVKNQKEVSQRD